MATKPKVKSEKITITIEEGKGTLLLERKMNDHKTYGTMQTFVVTGSSLSTLNQAIYAARWEQDMLINDWMALVMAQYVKRLLLREPIHTFLTYVGSNALAVRSIPVDDLPAYLNT